MIVLVLGGIRSGKSEIAEELAVDSGEPVTYVATASASGGAEFDERIARHRARRPTTWTTVEGATGLAETVASAGGTVLVDSLGTWIASVDGFEVDVDGFCRAVRARDGTTILVSEEVGLSVHPPTALGRAFADALGDTNRAVAAIADRVVLVVAGRTLELGAT